MGSQGTTGTQKQTEGLESFWKTNKQGRKGFVYLRAHKTKTRGAPESINRDVDLSSILYIGLDVDNNPTHSSVLGWWQGLGEKFLDLSGS